MLHRILHPASAMLATSCAVLALTLSRPAFAEAAEGSVLAIEANGDVLIDLGASRGAEQGAVLFVWRPLKLRHPVTKQMITDRILIGRIRLKQVRPALSIAQVEGPSERPFAPADIVGMSESSGAAAASSPAPPSTTPPPSRATPNPSASWTPSSPPAPKAPADEAIATSKTDPDAREVDALLTSVRGSSIGARITAYEQFVLAHPQNRHVSVLWDEAVQLRRSLKLEQSEANRKRDAPKAGSFIPPQTAPAHVPLEIALELHHARGALLHARRSGESGFTSKPMIARGPSYFAGTIPAEMMAEGRVEYFVEATDPKGETYAALGSAPAPLSFQAENPLPSDTRADHPDERSVTASALTDYASFNTKQNNDFVWQTEAQLGVRFRDVGLRALRSGFGAYRGKGGALADLDQGAEGRSVGLTYGYLETELAPDPAFAFVLRGIVGLQEDGVSGGAQGFVRIGNDRRTNLLFGGEVLGGIGLRGITQLQWDLTPKIPITVRSEVTNQPAGTSSSRTGLGANTSTGQGEVGVRSILQIGYRVLPHFVVAGRGSFQARTINHAGPGAGAAVTYEW